MMQCERILSILEVAGFDFLVERTRGGWRVETEQRGGVEGYCHEAPTLADALAQLTQTLALELSIDVAGGAAWLHDHEDDVDAPMPYELDAPLEFCQVVPLGSEEYRAYFTGPFELLYAPFYERAVNE